MVPLAIVLLGIGLNRVWPLEAGTLVPAPLRYWLGGLTIAGAFLGLGLWSVVLFRRSGQSEIPWKPTPAMVTRGPFRITRNPMYLQMVLICIGIAVIRAEFWIFILVPAAMWMLQRFAIAPEEAYLERKFGDEYLAYKRQVRRWL